MIQQCRQLNFVIDDDYNFVIDDGDDDDSGSDGGRGASAPLLKEQASPKSSRASSGHLDSDTIASSLPAPSPMRAVHSSHVLSGFGHVFAEHGKPQTQRAANELYAQSQDVNRVEHFVSHSWSAGHHPKWAAMADYYNRKHAVVTAYIWWLLAGVSATMWRLHTGEAMDFIVAFSLFTGMPGFILFFLAAFGHRIFPQLASQVFVDRICIHQWDDELKQRGIQGLGDVLLNSNRMMVLWSEDYFHRLWCIFEVATFRRDPSHMALLPLWATPFLYGMLICNLAVLLLCAWIENTQYFVLLVEFWGIPWGIGMFWTIGNLLPAALVCAIIRRGVVQKTMMERWVANFALDATHVTVDQDRTFIYGQIRSIFGTLSNFEKFVRKDMLVYLRAVIGPEWSFPYSWGAFVFQPYLWYLLVDAMSTTDEEVELQFPASHHPGWQRRWLVYAAFQLCYYGFIFLALPMALKVVALVAYLTLQWPTCVGIFLDIFVFLCLVFCFTCLDGFLLDLIFTQTVVLDQPPMTFSSKA